MMTMNKDGERQLALFDESQVHVWLILEICTERVDYCVLHSGISFSSRSNLDKCIAYLYIFLSISDSCNE